MAISHRIVQRHHGTLVIENNPDAGVSVKIRLPLAQS
ncbi:MAG: hypothetical protein M3T96_08470 [Acidobacteriota bacterium]|nr:hypothetical protein [Acidobacteriota bacterium]